MICTIICTGDSLRGRKIEPKGFVIAVNYAYRYFDYNIAYARDKVVQEEKPERLETITDHGGRWISTGIGVNREPNHISGYNSSLLNALNVAIQLGFKEIYVLGADNRVGEYIHFYDQKPANVDWTKINMYQNYFRNIIKFLTTFKEGIEDEQIYFVDSEINLFNNITFKEYNEL